MDSDQSGAFCFMGVSSKPAVFLSEKDSNRNTDPGWSSLVRPAMEIECQISTQEDQQLFARIKQQEECDLREEQNKVTLLKLAKVEVAPSSDDDYNEGFRTPTSLDQRIPAVLECPGAPRKIKTEAPVKRKACWRRIDFDPFEEMDVDGGDSNKKVKR